MSRKIAVVYEAPADSALACCLADRVLVSEIDWLEVELLDSQREWVLSLCGKNLLWRNIPELADELNIRLYGHFGSEPAEPDAKAARRAIAVIKRLEPAVAAIALVRDSDKQLRRQEGLAQAATAELKIPVVVGLAIPEREAWVLAGFDPADEAEQQRLQAERQRCGFDPREKSHLLMATSDNHAEKSAKRVLASLVGGNPQREAMCWESASLATLEVRGSENGLAAFLRDVRTKLVPLLTGRQVAR